MFALPTLLGIKRISGGLATESESESASALSRGATMCTTRLLWEDDWERKLSLEFFLRFYLFFAEGEQIGMTSLRKCDLLH